MHSSGGQPDRVRNKPRTVTAWRLHDLAVGELKAISWTSFDGMEIWGLLLTPPQMARGRRLPLLVYVHGGPGGGFTWGLFPQFMHLVSQVDPYPIEALASAGYAVLMPMPRGGAGYGEAGQKMIVNAWGEGDYRDIMAGVDHLVAAGIADQNRLGVMGASYGGYMTNWIVTQTSRFKAASSGASISDLADVYLLSEGGEFIAEYFKRRGRIDEAIEMFQALGSQSERYIDACAMAAVCHKSQQRRSEAIRLMERALGDSRCQGMSLIYVKYHLGLLYEEDGAMGKATQLYGSIPDILDASERLVRLQETASR